MAREMAPSMVLGTADPMVRWMDCEMAPSMEVEKADQMVP